MDTILMILRRIKWPNYVQFSIQLGVLGSGWTVTITMSVGLPEWESIITAGATEKTTLFLVRNRLVFNQKYAPLNAAVGSAGARRYWLFSGVQGRATAKIKHLKYCHNKGIPGFLQWRGFAAVAGPVAWNSLPTHITNIHTHAAFCRLTVTTTNYYDIVIL